MIRFESQEAFEDAVIEVLRRRMELGVTVHKQSMDWYGEPNTKVEVSLFDRKDGNDINRGSDYA